MTLVEAVQEAERAAVLRIPTKKVQESFVHTQSSAGL